MSRFSYRGVRWLSIEVIAEEWAKERHKHPSVIAQELQLAIMNKERFSQGLGMVEAFPSAENRPSLTTRLDKDFVEEFCAKQVWAKPKFWFGRGGDAPAKVGRPTQRDAIVQELTAIAERGELKAKLIDQCQHLSDWLTASDTSVPPSTPESIANSIRKLFWQLKRAAH